LITLLVVSAGAQSLFLLPEEEGSPLKGNFSYRFFRQDTLVRVEIPVQLSNNALQFVRDGAKYRARFKLSIAVYRKKELIYSDEFSDSVEVSKYEYTNLSEPWSAGKFSLTLPKGKYQIYLVLVDLNSRKKATAKFKIKVPEPKSIKISTPWFFVPESDSLILTDKIPVLWDSLGVMAEVYDIPETAEVKLEIVGVRYKPRDYPGKIVEKDGEKFAQAFFPIDSMPGGEYEAKLTLYSPNGSKIARAKTDFTLIQTPQSMIKYHFDELMDQLKLIANPSEIKELENTDSLSRDSVWAEFWKKRDPTPNTEYNEAKEEFFRRVQYSNQHFGTPYRPGWKSDRGRIYITYGPPDEIERHPFEPNYYAYEIWYYYSLGIAFVFVDEDGDGDYKLRETR